jgi:hypothetical protein
MGRFKCFGSKILTNGNIIEEITEIIKDAGEPISEGHMQWEGENVPT